MGLAIKRAREGSGHHPFRPSFSTLAGKPLGYRSLVKLENGDEVGPSVYEAAGRTLGLYYEDWDISTPLEILKGAKPPKGRLRPGAEHMEPALPDQLVAARDDEEETQQSVDEPRVPAPDPAEYAGLEEYLRATIKHLIDQGLPRAVVMRAADQVVAEYERKAAERNSPNAPGDAGGTNG